MADNVRRIRMMLYKVHDYDLVKYYISLRDKTLGNVKISFPFIMRKLLESYVRGEEFHPPYIAKFTDSKLPSQIAVRITLDTEADADIIAMIDSIADRQINSFLKSLLRRNLSSRDLRCYFKSDVAVQENESAKQTWQPKRRKEVRTENRANRSLSDAQFSTPVVHESDSSQTVERIHREDELRETPSYNERPSVVEQSISVPEVRTSEIPVELTGEHAPDEVTNLGSFDEEDTGFDFFGALGNKMNY